MTSERKKLFPRPSVASILPGKAHKIPLDKPDGLIRLSHNESGYGPSPQAVAAYRSVAGRLQRYPDSSQHELRQVLAEVHKLDFDGIICGNGSEELLGLLMCAYLEETDELLLMENHFIRYSVYGRIQEAAITRAPLADYRINIAATLEWISAATRMVVIANPNVPAGTCLTSEEIGELHDALPGDVLLVIDGAYMEYAAPDVAAGCIDLVDRSENVVMTRTFSKIYGLAGLRIGWAYCPIHVIETLQRIRSPFNTNAAALAAASAAVRDLEYTNSIREKNANSVRQIATALTAIELQVVPSVTNFYLVGFAGREPKNAPAAAAYLKAKNILPGPTIRTDNHDALRITVGNDNENNAVIAALTEYMTN